MFITRVGLIISFFSFLLLSCNDEKADLVRLTGEVMKKNSLIIEEGNYSIYQRMQEIYLENPEKVLPYKLIVEKISNYADSLHASTEKELLNTSLGIEKKQKLFNSILHFQKYILNNVFSERSSKYIIFDTLSNDLFNLPDPIFLDAVIVHITELKSIGFRVAFGEVDYGCFKYDIITPRILSQSKEVKLNTPFDFYIFLTTSRNLFHGVSVSTQIFKEEILVSSEIVTPNITLKSYPNPTEYGLKFNYTPSDTGNYVLKAILQYHYFNEIVEVNVAEDVKFSVK
ncbi:MAG: hypothetical protein M3Q58_09805 [Bacteroidota bacterium]|nr:hypothetical protein [Bacteroidota bacterium]